MRRPAPRPRIVVVFGGLARGVELEKSRWLIKIAISAACNHKRALETHLLKAREAGVAEDEIKHALLLLIPTVGFPTFMKSYAVLKNIE